MISVRIRVRIDRQIAYIADSQLHWQLLDRVAVEASGQAREIHSHESKMQSWAIRREINQQLHTDLKKHIKRLT